jgi:hypothetical protein
MILHCTRDTCIYLLLPLTIEKRNFLIKYNNNGNVESTVQYLYSYLIKVMVLISVT